jgi:hypothetical protein
MFSLLMMISQSSAEQKLIKVTGSTLITSSISEDILKQRAIADALQSVFLSNSLKIDSFTLMENGSIQLDQIQAVSGIEIINFEITDTSTRNGRFIVSATLIFSELSRQEPGASCKKLSAGEIPTELKISQDPNKQPFWLKFDERDFSKMLPFARGLNSLSLTERNKTNLNHSNYYVLHKKPVSFPQEPSPYHTELSIEFDYKKINNVLNNKQALSVTMSAKSYRETELIAMTTTQDEPVLSADILMLKTKSAGRKNLVQLKDDVQSKLNELLDAHMRALECVDVNPKVKLENNQLTVNYGELDGLEQHDLFMFTGNGVTRDFYKITELDDYTAKIAPVSANPTKRLRNGDQLDIISDQS